MRLTKPLRSIGIVPLLIMAGLLALVVSSQAYAHVETPSADIIHSCVKKSGEVHLLLDNGKKKADKCKKKDIQLDWNAQGIQGDPGQQGVQGDPGQQGIQGVTGDSGTSSWTDGAGIVTTAKAVGIGKTSGLITKLHVFGSPTANIAIDRGSQSGGFASLDSFNNMTSSTGWSVQMQPNSNNLSFLDRATGLTRVTLEQGTGNVGIGTDNPTAHLQVGSSPQNFSDVTTLGVGQGSGDTVALSLRRLSNDPIMQFCSDGTGGCSYVAFDRLTGEINRG